MTTWRWRVVSRCEWCNRTRSIGRYRLGDAKITLCSPCYSEINRGLRLGQLTLGQLRLLAHRRR